MTTRFDWLQYLDVSEHLLSQNAEGFYRSATSRAYYGVFCAIRDILEELRGSRYSPARNVHVVIADELTNDRRSEVERLGRDLRRLRRERNRADYDPRSTFTLSRASKSVTLARTIQESLSILTV